VWPRSELNLVLALFAGCVLAVGLVVGHHYLRRRLTTPEDIGDSLGLPLLGVMPRISELRGGGRERERSVVTSGLSRGVSRPSCTDSSVAEFGRRPDTCRYQCKGWRG
jgi:hypothetical protein